MATALECLGLAEPDDDPIAALAALLERLPRRLPRVAARGALEQVRYQDPSGVRLTLTQTPDLQVVDVLPSYAGPPGAHVDDLRVTTDRSLAVADIHETIEGEVLTVRMACDLVQSVFVAEQGLSGPAAITALGHDVVVHPDVKSYVASIGDGLPWGAESFMPLGLFGEGPPSALGRLSGVVLASSTREVGLTGHRIHVARVRSAGFEADVLLAPTEHEKPPVDGVVTGVVSMIAEMEQVAPRPRRRWFGR